MENENKRKKIRVNSKITSNIILAALTVIALLFYVQQFILDFDRVKEPGFWLNQVVLGVLMAALYYSILNVFFETQKNGNAYKLVANEYFIGLRVIKTLADKGAIEAIESHVRDVNKENRISAMKKILTVAVPSMYCDDLIILNTDFEKFEDMDEKFWNGYFKKYSLTEKRKKLILKAIQKIREGKFKYKRIYSETILVDSEYRKKESAFLNPDYDHSKEVGKGLIFKFLSFIICGAIFASIRPSEATISGWEIFLAVMSRVFMIAWSVAMGANKAFSLIGKRKSALRARCFLMVGAMVKKKLFDTFSTLLKKKGFYIEETNEETNNEET